MDTVSFEIDGAIAVVTIRRPDSRNAVDGATARALYEAFKRFDADDGLSVAAPATSGRWGRRGCNCPSR